MPGAHRYRVSQPPRGCSQAAISRRGNRYDPLHSFRARPLFPSRLALGCNDLLGSPPPLAAVELPFRGTRRLSVYLSVSKFFECATEPQQTPLRCSRKELGGRGDRILRLGDPSIRTINLRAEWEIAGNQSRVTLKLIYSTEILKPAILFRS